MICDFHQDIVASSNKDSDEDDDQTDNNAYENNNFDDDNVSLSFSLQASRESFNMLKERQPTTTDAATSENEMNETQFTGTGDGRSCMYFT